VLAWTTFAAGGVYPWAWAPASLGILLLAAAAQPAVGIRAGARALDLSLVGCGGAALLQLIPLPESLVARISPAALQVRSAVWFGGSAEGASGSFHSLTIASAETWVSVALATGAVVLFWTCREACDRGGSRQIIRGVAVIGLVASLVAMVQHSVNRELLYGIWRPLDAGARPFGPFVNRNHFATWVIMACPTVLGYLVARGRGRRHPGDLAQRLVFAIKQLESTSAWLAASACVMTIALLASTSRSGGIGLSAALLGGALLGRGRWSSRSRLGMALTGVLLIIVVLAFANLNAILLRVDETLSTGLGGRADTWEQARNVIRDFWLTGTGLGTFPTAMLLYQPPGRMLFANQAHNQYLQIASEGGLLVVLPAALVLLAFAALVRRRFIEDLSSSIWIRIGAVSGLLGVGVQSFWETGLRMPANAMLCAVLAAIAVHEPPDSNPR
jgi:O-antigen ligase